MRGARSDVALEVDYAYSAYGEVATLGPDGGNALQYTGRENDGTGLYYYRARYYDPVLKQFVSEDPIGMTGGPNLRQYVGANPISFADPEGLQPGPNPNNLPLGQRLGVPGPISPRLPPGPAPAPSTPMTCMEKCMLRKVGIQAGSSATGTVVRQVAQGTATGFSVTGGGLGISSAAWTSAAGYLSAINSVALPAALALAPSIGLLWADQCDQECNGTCPPSSSFFGAP